MVRKKFCLENSKWESLKNNKFQEKKHDLQDQASHMGQWLARIFDSQDFATTHAHQ